MGADIECKKLLDERNNMLNIILAEIQGWDKSLDLGIEIIDSNQLRIKRISDINEVLLEQEVDIFQGDYKEKIEMIFKELTILNNSLRDERKKIIKEKIALCKRDDLIDSYITNNQESVFIDKDI